MGSAKATDLLGGTSGYTDGKCPATAEEAAQLHRSQSQAESLGDEQANVQKAASSSDEAVAETTRAGCCFSFGYGSLMKPCCLETNTVDDVAFCLVEKRLGGASSYSVGKCPSFADEAAAFVQHAKASVTEAWLH